jgi:hypothetical protein
MLKLFKQFFIDLLSFPVFVNTDLFFSYLYYIIIIFYA